MPLSNLNIEEVVAKIFDVLEVFLENSFKLLKTLLDLGTLGASKYGHADLGALASELKLAFADLL